MCQQIDDYCGRCLRKMGERDLSVCQGNRMASCKGTQYKARTIKTGRCSAGKQCKIDTTSKLPEGYNETDRAVYQVRDSSD